MRAKIRLSGTAVCLALAAASNSGAQNWDLETRLRNASRIECLFTRVARGNWTGSETGFSTEPVEYAASFHDIDAEGGTAEAEGRFSDSYIIVRYAQGYLHFMQTLASGPLYLTTVIAEPTQDGRLKAVHTRHEFTPVSLPNFTSQPEMYLGDCSVSASKD